MWHVFEHKAVAKSLKTTPRDITIKYEAWKRIVELQGPLGLRYIKGFHDESLKGKWNGFRSSRFGLKWRIIYKVFTDRLEVYVFEINSHDYRRR